MLSALFRVQSLSERLQILRALKIFLMKAGHPESWRKGVTHEPSAAKIL
jgi:hypothetical protein